MSADDQYVDNVRRELRLARVLGEPVYVNTWLIVSNVGLWALALFYGLFWMTDGAAGIEGFGFSGQLYPPDTMAFYTGMKVNSEIAAGAWWRLPSSMWVHIGAMHLGFNIYGLWVLGPILEKFYGSRRYLLLYVVSGIVAAGASYAFNDVDSGGASGAIYGLVGALVVLGWKYRGSLPERVTRSFTVGLVPWVALSIGIGFFDAIPFDNAAHLGGLFSGMAIALALGSRLEQRTERVGDVALWLGASASIVVVVLTAFFWSEEATNCLSSRDAYLECYPELRTPLLDPQKALAEDR